MDAIISGLSKSRPIWGKACWKLILRGFCRWPILVADDEYELVRPAIGGRVGTLWCDCVGVESRRERSEDIWLDMDVEGVGVVIEVGGSSRLRCVVISSPPPTDTCALFDEDASTANTDEDLNESRRAFIPAGSYSSR